MSDAWTEPERVEGFLRRWSRLKRGAQRVEPPVPPVPVVEPLPAEPVRGTDLAEDLAAQHRDQDAAAAEPFDPACLPPVEELGAESDYKPFLSERVPEELRRLALRKAWASDPAIANFQGFAEYDWDCNAPGYGRLLAVDDVERLARAVFGNQPDAPPPEALPPAATADEATGRDTSTAAAPADAESASALPREAT